MTGDYFAHTLPGSAKERWQSLREHLEAAARTAGQFAAVFGAREWGEAAGRWHDLGKYSEAFQDYLKNAASPDSHQSESRGKTDHSTAGAQHAAASLEILGHLLAYVIAGHHSGLLNGRDDGPCLEARLKKTVQPYAAAPSDLLRPPNLAPPPMLTSAFQRRDAFSVAFFTRMLFSCLVDADFLDTERFMDRQRAALRPEWPSDLLERMETELVRYVDGLGQGGRGVDRERAEVRQACLEAAPLPPGFFSLTVPTGGGKTLSSLAFGLRHARVHGLRRMVYVLPFTTIIEQNAEAFRRVFSGLAAEGLPDPVIEHHSNLDVGEQTVASRLAAENWEAPLVVTTSVQFYESLFASRPTRCRKLHNLAKAVIILDEVQTLPVDFLKPCLRALEELTETYAATVVLCTATQPAVHRRDDFPIGLAKVREIVPDPPSLYRRLKRVEVIDLGFLPDSALAERLAGERQALCVVNTRGHARSLYEALDQGAGRFHLSALMCPQHRSLVIARIRRKLAAGRPCLVVSTPLIEAGVDIDFPVVYRALAGLDSLAQAAGRCNRNGSLNGLGRTFVFRSEHARAEHFLRETADCASQVLALGGDPLSLEPIERYFRLYYWDQQERWDSKNTLDRFHLLQDRSLPFDFGFRRVAEDFRLIENLREPVIVPWDAVGRELCERLRNPWTAPRRDLLRSLQRYTVQIDKRVWDLELGRSIEWLWERYPVLTSPEIHYDQRLGLCLDSEKKPFLNV